MHQQQQQQQPRMNRRLKRSIPFLKMLKQAPVRTKQKLIRTFPPHVLDDMIEILYNILFENVHVRNSNHRTFMKKHKTILTRMFNARGKRRERNQLLLDQKGGFFAGLLPILASVLAATAL